MNDSLVGIGVHSATFDLRRDLLFIEAELAKNFERVLSNLCRAVTYLTLGA